MTTARFADSMQSLRDFAHDVLVACPRCGARAVVKQVAGGKPDLFAPHRLACTACGQVADSAGGQVAFSATDPRDPFLGLPLWLQAPCCGQVLWAYNADHLAMLESFIGATLRERARDGHGGSNRSIASRLPAWTTARNHRAEVLRVIAQLKARR